MKDSIQTFIKKRVNKPTIAFLDALIYRIGDHEVFPKGGMLSYFITLSTFPFLIALLNIINYTPLVEPDFLKKIIGFLPNSTGDLLQSFIGQISLNSSASLLSLSLITGLWSASSGVRQLIKAINTAYDTEEDRNFLQLGIMGLAFTIGLILMVLLLFGSQIVGSNLIRDLADLFNLNQDFVDLLSLGLKIIGPLYVLIYLVLIYSLSPSIPVKKFKWKTLLPGAIFALVGISLGTLVFTFYVSNFGSYSVTYGSLTGIILFFLWIYLVSTLLLIGGEINAVLFTKDQENLCWPREDSVLKDIID